MVRYDPYTDSFIDNPTKEITATINLDAIPKDIIQINEVVEVSDESIEKIADAVVRKLADRKTEPSNSEKTNNCDTCMYGEDKHRYAHICNECGVGINNYEPKTEPQIDCFLCKWLGEVDVCGRCRNRNLFAEADTEPIISKMEQVDEDINVRSKDEPQTYKINPKEPTNGDKCFKCYDFFTCGGQCNKVEDEPQAERSE